MRPLECLIVPELARLQDILERRGMPDELQTALDGLDPEQYRSLSHSYGIEVCANGPPNHTLFVLFKWGASPQGSTFWREVYETIYMQIYDYAA